MSAELYENLNKLETEELIYKINNSMFSAEAHKIALNLLAERGANSSDYKQLSEENGNAETYGIATVQENDLSTNSFINLFLVIALPLIVLSICVIGIHFINKFGFASYLLMTIAVGSILKKSYYQLFSAKDKFHIGLKASTYGASVIIASFFVFSLFYKVID